MRGLPVVFLVMIFCPLASASEKAAGVITVKVTEVTIAEKDLSLREAMIREIIVNLPDVKTWFVNFGQQPDLLVNINAPSPEFLKRFSDLPVKVKSVEDSLGAVPKRTSPAATAEELKDGWYVWCDIVRWIDENTAEVEYGFYKEEEEVNSGSRGEAKYKDGKWEFTIQSGWLSKRGQGMEFD